MWKFKITDNLVEIFNGSEHHSFKIYCDDTGYYINCWGRDNPLSILLNEEYRESHGLSMRGTFPYHWSKDSLIKTVENLWYENHSLYLIDYDLKFYSNIIKFTINGNIYKFRIKSSDRGYYLNPTKVYNDFTYNILFNHELLGRDHIKWREYYHSKEDLINFIFDYQQKARFYKFL